MRCPCQPPVQAQGPAQGSALICAAPRACCLVICGKEAGQVHHGQLCKSTMHLRNYRRWDHCTIVWKKSQVRSIRARVYISVGTHTGASLGRGLSPGRSHSLSPEGNLRRSACPALPCGSTGGPAQRGLAKRTVLRPAPIGVPRARRAGRRVRAERAMNVGASFVASARQSRPAEGRCAPTPRVPSPGLPRVAPQGPFQSRDCAGLPRVAGTFSGRTDLRALSVAGGGGELFDCLTVS